MKHILLVLLASSFSFNLKAQKSTDPLNNDTTIRNLNPDSTKCAILFLYRKKGLSGSLISCDLYKDHSAICRIKNNSKFIIKLYKEGLTALRTKKTDKVYINVEFGKEYYLRCSTVSDLPAARPKLELVSAEEGKIDFDNVKGKQSAKND